VAGAGAAGALDAGGAPPAAVSLGGGSGATGDLALVGLALADAAGAAEGGGSGALCTGATGAAMGGAAGAAWAGGAGRGAGAASAAVIGYWGLGIVSGGGPAASPSRIG
jgi:hypothetical protein